MFRNLYGQKAKSCFYIAQSGRYWFLFILHVCVCVSVFRFCFSFLFSGSPFRIGSLEIKECVNCMWCIRSGKKPECIFFFLYVWHNIYPLFHISRKWLLHYRYTILYAHSQSQTRVFPMLSLQIKENATCFYLLSFLALFASSLYLPSLCCSSLAPSCLIALIASLSLAIPILSYSLSSSVLISHSFRCV